MGVQPGILLYIFCIQYVTANNIISDMTDEHCINKKLCEVAGIVGHVDCISDTCVCINNAKVYEFNNTRGCYKNNTLGKECEFDQDCRGVDNAKCTQQFCKKICECKPNRKNVNGACEVIKNKPIGTYCESNDECIENLKCINNKCNCKPEQFYANNKCFTLKDYNMCRNVNDCKNPTDYFCEMRQTDLMYGFCHLKGERLEGHPCSTTENCPNNGYVDCQRGVCTCVHSSTSNNNGCYKQNGIGEKCQFDEECNNKAVCKVGDHTNIKRCMCPEKRAYYNNTCINIEYQPWCAKNTDCVVKNSICEDSVCKCSNGTIVLNDTCIELKGQKYGDFCHKKCASSSITCIQSDHSSTIGVCGCHYNYDQKLSVCTPCEISGDAVNKNTGTIISVEIYCFLFIHFIIIYL